MTRLLLILVMLVQLSGCASVFWETAGATLLGNLGSELIKHQLAEEEEDEKEKPEK